MGALALDYEEYRDKDAYTEAVIESIIEEKVEIYRGKPMGMYLNSTVYFPSLVKFELMKYGTKVNKEVFDTEYYFNRLEEIGGTCVWLTETQGSLKDMLKRESWFSIIFRFMCEMKEGTLYPSQVKRKEKVLENQYKRACKKIDRYFEQEDIELSGVSSHWNMLEVGVTRNGDIDIHGEDQFNFVISDHTCVEDMKNALEDRKESILLGTDMIKQDAELLMAVDHELKDVGFVNSISVGGLLNNVRYSAGNWSVEDYLDRVRSSKDALVNLGNRMSGLVKKGKLMVDDEFKYVHYGYWKTSIEGLIRDEDRVAKDLEEFKKVASFIKEVSKRKDRKTGSRFYCEDGKLVIEVSERMRNHVASEKLVYFYGEGTLWRGSGDPVLTEDVVVYEIEEAKRQMSETYELTQERAKELLLASFTEEEESMFVNEGLALLDGGENFYAVLDGTRYNSVVKIPKNVKDLSEISSLCIHPKNPKVPLYDGLTAITFALKTGDEQYVLDNSNEFSVDTSLKKKCMSLIENWKQAVGGESMVTG